MSYLKKYWMYIKNILIFWAIVAILMFVGLNANYHNIEKVGELPSSISVEKAEATSKAVRIYGYVSNNDDIDVNGMYIKVFAYDENDKLVHTENLEIKGVEKDGKKLFRAKFLAYDVKKYSINIVNEI